MSGLGPLPRLHPRTLVVNKAEVELGSLLIDWRKKYDLTLAEELGMLLDAARSLIKYAIRSERHPDDPDARGDEE